MNSFTKLLDISSNMMISTLFTNHNQINQISTITFLVILFFKVQPANNYRGSIPFKHITLLAFLKIIHYTAFIYNLISYSFLMYSPNK